jgi:hypothetical protein
MAVQLCAQADALQKYTVLLQLHLKKADTGLVFASVSEVDSF